MAKFEPVTDVTICKGTGVTNQNIPYFDSQVGKVAWLFGFAAGQFHKENYSYQRTFNHFIRVDDTQEVYRDCDVLMFQNENGRWIICNILYVEFINPNCTEIGFEVNWFLTYIDVIQWKDCFIEREMQENDWTGGRPSFNNLVPEGLETGKFKAYEAQESKTFVNFDCVVMSAYDRQGESNNTPQIDCGYVTGLNQFVVSKDELGGMLQAYADKGRLDGIAAIFMCPTEISSPKNAAWSEGPTAITIDFSSIEGYVPQNSKVFTGEFFYYRISNRQGVQKDLYLEDFANPGAGTFELSYTGAFLGGSGGIVCYPRNYQGQERALDYGVTLNVNTQCAYIGDAFANYVANNKWQIANETVGAFLDLGKAVTGPRAPIPSSVGPAELANRETYKALEIADSVNQGLAIAARLGDRAQNPAMYAGQVGQDALMIALRAYGFLVTKNHPPVDMVQRIDNFFTMYGYRTLRVKKPNVNTRPFWNYVKTAGGYVGGPMPFEARQAIGQTMDAGVTFWNVNGGAVIGDYSMDNRG